MNSSQEKTFFLHYYSKYGLYVIWYGVTRHNYIVHLSDIFFFYCQLLIMKKFCKAMRYMKSFFFLIEGEALPRSEYPFMLYEGFDVHNWPPDGYLNYTD